VAKVGKLEISGFIGWVAWLAIHLLYLVGFRSRASTLLSWAVTFFGRGRAQMASTEQQVFARNAMGELEKKNKEATGSGGASNGETKKTAGKQQKAAG
ncbi:NAD(P)/FAD-dependent oxidoreductase, partial [Rhodococcus qingshengii]